MIQVRNCGCHQGAGGGSGEKQLDSDIFRCNMVIVKTIILQPSFVDRYFNKNVSSVMISIKFNLSFLTLFN